MPSPPSNPPPADFVNAHGRHWEDAEYLYADSRWANADHLYGVSAECGLKAIMKALKMPVDQSGSPTIREYRTHVDQLWPAFRRFLAGRNGTRYVSFVPRSNPFNNWSITDRYLSASHFSQQQVKPHKSAAARIVKMIKQAQQDRLL